VVTLLECNIETVLVVSDVSYLDDENLEEANLSPIPLSSPNSSELLLDSDISLIEVAVLKWTYPEEEWVGEDTPLEGGEMNGVDDPELNHLYDDTMDLGLSSNEDLRSSQGHLGSPGGVQSSSGSIAGPDSSEEHTYVNFKKEQEQQQQQQQQQQSTLPLSLENLREREKKFFEEDEDAG
jgi:hypothetical protein